MQTGFAAPLGSSEQVDEVYVAQEAVKVSTGPYVLLSLRPDADADANAGADTGADTAPAPSTRLRPGHDPSGLLTPASGNKERIKNEGTENDSKDTATPFTPVVPIITYNLQKNLGYCIGVGSAAFMSSASQLPPLFQIGAASMMGLVGAETIFSYTQTNSKNQASLRKSLLMNAVGSAATLSTMQYLFSDTIGFWALPLGFACAKIVAPCVKQALAPCVKPYAANLSTWWKEKSRTVFETIKKFDLPTQDTGPTGSGLMRKLSF